MYAGQLSLQRPHSVQVYRSMICVVREVAEPVDPEGLFALYFAFEVLDLRKRVRPPFVGEDVWNDREYVEVLRVRQDIQEDEHERRVPPEPRMLEHRNQARVVHVGEQLRENASEWLPPTGVNRLAIGARFEHERRADIQEVGGHHRDDDEENQDRLGEDVAVGVVAERHPGLVFDGLRVAAVLAALHPPQIEEQDRADDGSERGQLFDEGVQFANQVVGAQQPPEIEAGIKPASPQHEAVEQEHLEGDEDPDMRKPGQCVVGHPLLPKGVDQKGLRPVGDLLAGPCKTRVRHPNLDLPQPPKRGPREKSERAHQQQRHPNRTHRLLPDLKRGISANAGSRCAKV